MSRADDPFQYSPLYRKVEVGSRWRKQKWGAHCKTPDNAYNDYGIGICVVGEYSNKLPSTAQLQSLRRLVTFLCDRYNIDPANVIGHRDAPGTRTECPGDVLRRYIQNDDTQVDLAHLLDARKQQD